MPKYVSLLTFTEQGVKNLRKTTARAEAFQELIEKGGRIKILFTLWTIGRYDVVHIFEADDDETAASVAYSLSVLGNVRTETLRAFEREEMEAILGRVNTPYDLIQS